MNVYFIMQIFIASLLILTGLAFITYSIVLFINTVNQNHVLKVLGLESNFIEKTVTVIVFFIGLLTGLTVILIGVKAFQLWL